MNSTRNADFTLANGSLNTSDGLSMTLSGVTVANLTATTTAHVFNLDNAAGSDHWTGTGTLTSNGGTGTINVTRNANFTIASGSLSTSDGMAMTLNNSNGNLKVANLTALTTAHTFTLDAGNDHWTGTGHLVNASGSGTLNVSRNADFTLASGSINLSDGTSMTLTGFGVANLASLVSPHNFSLETVVGSTPDKWTGTGSLTGSGGGTVISTRNANFTLVNGSLSASDGLSMTRPPSARPT